MNLTLNRMSLTMIAMAAALALSACDRGGDGTMRTDTAGKTASTSPSPTTNDTTSPPVASTAPSPGTTAADNAPSMSGAANTSGTGSAMSSAPLAPADMQFVTNAAEGGQFEVEVAKLAADKASSPEVKSYAQMLVADHSAANDKLRQIASSHNVALPASLPADKKKEIDMLANLSGAEFDKQFVKIVGIKDHHHDIADFEKASKTAQADDVKNFAESALPTLKKHMAAAEKLPTKG